MENVKNAKNSSRQHKNKPIFIKIVFIVLFFVLLPFMIIGYLISFIIKKNKKKKWLKEGLRGKVLILKTDIKTIDKMLDFEFENYLKTLFFYGGYKVSESDKDKGVDSFLIEKNSNKIVVCFLNRKNYVKKKSIEKVVKLMRIYKVNNAFFVSTNSFSSKAQDVADLNNVFLMDREKLVCEYEKVKEKISEVTTNEDLIDKFDKNIQDRFPHII